MSRKAKVISGIIAFVTYALLTGGLMLVKDSSFGGQRNIVLASGLRSDLWLSPQWTEFHLPPVAHYSGTSGPFGLRIQIWDESQQYTALDIEHITIAYSDGETVEKSMNWSRELKDHTAVHNSSNGIVKTPMKMLSATIENLVNENKDAEITITGQLTSTDGSITPFKTTERFEAEFQIGVITFWSYIAGI